jgi:hypothetical protein
VLASIVGFALTGCPFAADDYQFDDGGAAGGATATDGAAACGVDPNPPGGECPAVCSGGCDAGTCVIACRGEQLCKEATLACPEGFACRIECHGHQSCEDAIVTCPALYRCEVDCLETQACKEMKLGCGTGSCTIVCGIDQACEHTEFRCAAGAACQASCAGSAPDIKGCNEACSCETC